MTDLLHLIRSRQSTRTPFDPQRPIAKEDLHKIFDAGSWAPTAHNMQNYEILVVDDRALLDQIRRMPFRVNETFIQENYLQLSFSEDELKSKKTGILSTMFPKSWLHPGLIPEHSHENEPEHPLLERHNQMLACPVLIILLYNPQRRAPASEGDFLGIMSLGCVLENMWLMAASLGISLHVVSALSEEPVQSSIRKLLHIPDHFNIAISFRLGYPLSATDYLRVRRDAEDYIHYNNFIRKKNTKNP